MGEWIHPDFLWSNEHNFAGEGQLTYRGIPVFYQGRIDLILEDMRDGLYWILDHKTAAQFGQTEHLELDAQCGSYVWGLKKMLNLDVQGIIYSESRKKVPKRPDVLKNGNLSKNKNQGTSYYAYLEAIEEGGHEIGFYREFLDYLQTEGQEYFRRMQVHRSRAELASIERNIQQEAIDMLNNPSIYPNPDRWNCNGCVFRTPCLMRQDNSDWQWHLDNSGLYIRPELSIVEEEETKA
jgi:CRISPR/Cas system-associated exonuclease Cas4 (RecB family)